MLKEWNGYDEFYASTEHHPTHLSLKQGVEYKDYTSWNEKKNLQ